MVLYELRVFLHPLAQAVEERGLQAREAIVEPRDVRLGKLVGFRVALPCQPVDNRAAWIAQPHHLRALVYGFARSIVNRLSEHLHVVVGIHLHNLRIAATHQQAEERERGQGVLVAGFLDEVCHDMSLQVIDIDEGNAQRTGKALSKIDTYEQRAHQPRATGEGNGRELFLRDACQLDGLVYHWHHVLLMGTRCQLGHHPTVGLVYGLRCRHVAQQHPVSEHCCRGIVATRLYT